MQNNIETLAGILNMPNNNINMNGIWLQGNEDDGFILMQVINPIEKYSAPMVYSYLH